MQSHPSRVRELKPARNGLFEFRERSHPSRVRELKLQCVDYDWRKPSRTPHGGES